MPGGVLTIAANTVTVLWNVEQRGSHTMSCSVYLNVRGGSAQLHRELSRPYVPAQVTQSMSVSPCLLSAGLSAHLAVQVKGSFGFNGNGITATTATLQSSTGVALHPDGSIYITDTSNSMIRRVRPDGIIVAVAGSGGPGPFADGGPAVNASLTYPLGNVVFDKAGGIFFIDYLRVRKVDAAGLISTVVNSEGVEDFNGESLEH